MKRASYPASLPAAEAPLLVLLPGFDMTAEDFLAHGFMAALREAAGTVDLLIIEPDLDLYLDGTVGQSIAAVIAEVRARRAGPIWLAGVSLGCFGALLAAICQPGTIAGIILISPFLGVPGMIAEIHRAGGLAAWTPSAIADNDSERRVLAWLKSHTEAAPRQPILHLGYARSDRFAAGAALLAARLPAAWVTIVEGGHDWSIWALLWRRILAAQSFAGPS